MNNEFISGANLKRCPICGKKPKIKIENYSYNGMGAYVTIRCKPFLHHSHLEVTSGKASLNRAAADATEYWNEKVDQIEGD